MDRPRIRRERGHDARGRRQADCGDRRRDDGGGDRPSVRRGRFSGHDADIEQRFVDGGFRRIKEPLQKRVEKGKMAQAEVDGILSKIRGVVPLKEAVIGAQVVIEAVFEKMDVKRELYAELEKLCPPEVVFASNTSSLSITEMA